MSDVSLRDRRRALLEDADLGGAEFCRAYTAQADAWLSLLADRASDGSPRHLALLAVGGYGRSELCPFSDLDVVLVHDGRRNVAAVADAIWYPVWDQGVHLDHSVRRPAEVLSAADEDLRVALGLLDARLVWGDPKVAEPLVAKAVDRWRTRLGAHWLPALAEQMEERRRVQGDVAFLLEPDLKEGHGGLRDVNVLRAMAVYAPLLADYVDLDALDPAAALLTAVRVELHRSAGRELDRLLLQEQDHIADVLSYTDADALMADVSAAGRAIAWISEDAWRRRRFWQPEPTHRSRGLFARRGGGHGAAGPSAVLDAEVEPGVAIVGGEVALTPSAAVLTDSSLPLRLAAVAAERELPDLAAAPCTGWPTRWPRRPTRGRPRRGRRWCGCWPPGIRPSTPSRHSTTRDCWSGSSPSGRRCGTSPSATPTTASPSTATSSRRRPTPPTSSTGSTAPTYCSWARSCTTSARATPATTPTPASS